MDTWKPITRDEMAALLDEQLAECQPDELEQFSRIRVPLRPAPIERCGKIESVFVVAALEDWVLVFEDIEQGFEWCRPDETGVIRQYGCSQFSLRQALYQSLHRNAQ